MDREEKLYRLREIKDELDQLKVEYEELRDEVVPEVEEDGVVWVLGPDNKKYRCSVQRQMTSTYDVDALAAAVSEDVLDEVTFRKVDSDKFEQAYNAGRIPHHAIPLVIKRKPKAAFVDFKVDDKA